MSQSIDKAAQREHQKQMNREKTRARMQALRAKRAQERGRMKPITLDDEYSYTLHMTGTASTLGPEAEDEIVKRLHAVVEEVTGKPVDKPIKRSIGFMPWD